MLSLSHIVVSIRFAATNHGAYGRLIGEIGLNGAGWKPFWPWLWRGWASGPSRQGRDDGAGGSRAPVGANINKNYKFMVKKFFICI